MDEVRRASDGEVCGHVVRRDGSWFAVTVFGGVLDRYAHREDAVEHVLAQGLAALAERWTLRHGTTGDKEIVCIQEASPKGVTVARGYYSMPGVPTLSITAEELVDGSWELRR